MHWKFQHFPLLHKQICIYRVYKASNSRGYSPRYDWIIKQCGQMMGSCIFSKEMMEQFDINTFVLLDAVDL